MTFYVYCSVIRSLLEYTCAVWILLSKNCLKIKALFKVTVSSPVEQSGIK